jgi:DnaJ-class molecular chaperone
MFGTNFAENMQQRSARLQLWISLYDVAVGGPRVVAVGTRQGQHTAEIHIPPGIEDGDTVRYAGAGFGNSDLVITFKVKPESTWQRQGNNLVTETHASIWDLILGAELQINNISGNSLTVTLPSRTQPGTLLRLRGHGLPNKHNQGKGDMLLKINATLPDHIPDNLVELIRQTRQL